MNGEMFLCVILAAILVINIIAGYGFKILLDIGFVYFTMITIVSSMCNRAISEIDIILTCIFAACYVVTWSAEKISKSSKDEMANTDGE